MIRKMFELIETIIIIHILVILMMGIVGCDSNLGNKIFGTTTSNSNNEMTLTGDGRLAPSVNSDIKALEAANSKHVSIGNCSSCHTY